LKGTPSQAAASIAPDPQIGTRSKHGNALLREWKHFRKNSSMFVLSLPAILLIFVFAYLPMFGVVIAFKKFRVDKGILGSDWVGLENFRFFFQSDIAFRVTRNTVLYNLSYIILTTLCALALAIMLNEINKRYIKIYQTSMFIPYFLSWVVVSYVVLAFLDHQSGFLNGILKSLGKDPIKWYQESQYWPWILNIAHLWKSIGFSTLIYYAGIMGIDSTYYEAARIDGASRLQMIRKITIPLLMPLIVILLILAIGHIFSGDFGLHYFVPNNTSFLYASTDIIDTYVFRALRDIGDMGMASAVGFYQSLVGLVLIVVANTVVRKINDENSLW